MADQSLDGKARDEREPLSAALPIASPVLALDVSRYSQHIAELEITEAQANELLKTLWGIMSAFVDLGFGGDPLRLAVPLLFEDSFPGLSNEVSLEHTDNSSNAEDAARKDGPR